MSMAGNHTLHRITYLLKKNTELNLGVVKYTAELKRDVQIKNKEYNSVNFRMFGLSLQVHNFYLDFYGGALL